MRTLVLESVIAGRTKQLQYLLAQSRRIVAGGFDVPSDLDVNHADRSGVTPLHTAVLKGNLQMVKLLLEAGADCFSADSLGQTPLDLAQSKQKMDIVQVLHAHLSSHRVKSPRSRMSTQHINAAGPAPAPRAELATESSSHAPVAVAGSSTVALSPWSGFWDHRSRQAAGKALPSGQLLRALSVSSVKQKSAVASVLVAAPIDSAGQPISGGAPASMNAASEVPRDAVLDFKQWMKQKLAATASSTSLTPLSEVPEATADDEEVCVVNRPLLRTGCSKRPGVMQRPITPTIYGGARPASSTPVTSSNSHRQLSSAASPAKMDWLLAPQQSSIYDSGFASSVLRPDNKLAPHRGTLSTKPKHTATAKSADELPRLPSSFLPRELDPLEAARVQEQRNLAAMQLQMLTFEQEARSMTPAALNRLKRRVLGASACTDDASSPLAAGGDGVDSDVEATAPLSGFRSKRQAGLRLRRLVL